LPFNISYSLKGEKRDTHKWKRGVSGNELMNNKGRHFHSPVHCKKKQNRVKSESMKGGEDPERDTLEKKQSVKGKENRKKKQKKERDVAIKMTH